MSDHTTIATGKSFPLRFGVGIWLVVSAALAVVLPAPHAPPPLRLALILGPVLVFAISVRLSTRLCAALDALDARWIVALHAIRAVIGVAFLLLGRAGQLPWEFASAAGVGDAIAGVAAIGLVVAWSSLTGKGGRALLLVWNLFGIADFINVQRVALSLRGRESEFVAMLHLPMSLVPYVGVPLLFASHLFLVAKYRRLR
jgi:hypothetical protein